MSGKPSLNRAGTMQVTSKEGVAFLDRNLTDWKKEYLIPEGENENEATASSDSAIEEELTLSEEEAPPAKKPKMAKHTTMKGTAKEAKGLLKGEKLGDTRQESAKKKSKPAMKRDNTVKKTLADAAAYGDTVGTGARQLRKRKAPEPTESPKKPALKKKGTMQNTAKEGNAFLKRNKGSAKKGKGKKK